MKSRGHIGVVLPASSEAAIATLAIQLRGAVVVHLNPRTEPQTFRHAISSASITQLVTSRRYQQALAEEGIDLAALLQDVEVLYLEDLIKSIPPWRSLLAKVQFFLLPARGFYRLYGRSVGIEDPAAILFNSGSGTEQDAVVLSHRNIMSNCKQISDVLNTRVDDVIMSSLPPCHSFGFTVTTVMPLVEGIPMACHPLPADVLGIAKAVAVSKAHHPVWHFQCAGPLCCKPGDSALDAGIAAGRGIGGRAPVRTRCDMTLS